MMKKIFLSMLAIVSMLFVTSCSQDELANESSNDDFVKATFTIGATDGIGTRATTIGTASKINWVACAIYDEDGAKMDLDQTVPFVDGQATYNVRLAKGQNYRAVFFAYCGNENKESAYYVLSNLKNIQINNAKSNIEERDAFTAYYDIVTGKTMNAINETITLYRPFAQLNLGIDDTEFEAAEKAGVVVAKSQIVVSNVYKAFSAYDNEVVGNTDTMKFALNAIPTEDLKIKIDGEDKYYNYLALNYLLVGDLDSEKSTTNVEFVWENADGSKTNNPTTQFLNIPVQRNYRTNILGKLLTSPAEFTIKIDAEFEKVDNNVNNPDYNVFKVDNVADLQEAINAATDSATIYIAQDITGDVTVNQGNDGMISIIGDGHTFNGVLTIDGKSATNMDAGLIIKDLKFSTPTIGRAATSSDACIRLGDGTNATRYTCNVTIDNCIFDASGLVGIKSYTGGDKNLTVINCTATEKAHSLLQVKGIDGVLVKKCIVNSKNGMNFNNSTNVVVEECTADVKGYAVRFGESSGGSGAAETYWIKNSTLKSACEETGDAVIILRGTADNSTLTIENTTIEGRVRIANSATNAIVNFDDTKYGYRMQDGDYYIYNATGLKWLANEVNSGKNNFEGLNVILEKDINLNDEEWTPIGTFDNSFDGNFDGQNHVIKNLKITRSAKATDEVYIGLFGVTANNIIQNFTIENVNISSEGQIVAAAIGYPYYTEVKNITIQGIINIKGGNYTAGVIAYTRLCVNASNLSVVGNSGSSITGAVTVGGVIPDIQMNKGLVANYSNFAASGLTIKGEKSVGGISGIISLQTLNGATVKNVTIECNDARTGIVAGALGGKSTITNISYENVTGATSVVGATYDNAADVVVNGDVYEGA